MATAICTKCDAYWMWSAKRGTRLADLLCTDCGGTLRAAKGLGTGRWRWPLGMRIDDRIVSARLNLDLGVSPAYRKSTQLELDDLLRRKREMDKTYLALGGDPKHVGDDESRIDPAPL